MTQILFIEKMLVLHPNDFIFKLGPYAIQVCHFTIGINHMWIQRIGLYMIWLLLEKWTATGWCREGTIGIRSGNPRRF